MKLAYSVKEAAQEIGVSPATIWRRIADQEIATFKLGCRTLIRGEALQAFVDSYSKAA